MPVKDKSKTTKKRTCWLFTKNRSIERRNWIDIEPGKYSFSDYEVSKKVTYLPSSFKTSASRRRMEQFISGESKKIFRVNSHSLFIGLTVGRKHAWQEEEEIRERFQYCTDASGTIVYFRALQGHSGRNLICPLLQDNVIIQSNFFQHIYHVGCAFNLHSIINSGLIPGGQN